MKKLSDNGQFKKAIDLYEDQVKKDKNQNTSLAVNQALKSCIDLDDIKRGKYIHENLSSTRKKNPFIQANLIRLYMKCGDYEKSKQIFIDSNNKTTNMLNNILKGLADNSRHEEALNLFKEIDIKTDEYTFSFILNKQEQRAIDLFFQIKKPSKAILRIFFNACAQLQTENALTVGKNVFDQLAIDSNESKDVLNMALNIFIKCGDLKSAECLFNRIDRTIICYGSMMKLYNIKDQPEKTLELFQRMKQETLIPDEICYVLLIDALSKIGDLSLGQSFLCGMPKHFLSNSWIQVALIDIWGKVGSPDKSKEIFDMIEHPDRVAFGAMINAYGLNGMGLEAIESFNRIPSNMLDNVIYICALNACSHSALIGQAWEIFEKIPLNQRTEQIYTTMVDTISRVSLFDQALELIDEYEQSHNPSIPMYMSILSSARNAKNVSLSEKVFHCIESNFPNNESYLTSARILLANAYSLSGNKLTSSNVRVKVNQSSEKKVAGCSWTVVNGKRFRAHEKSNPYSSQIFKESTRLIDRLIKHGYKPDESWITRELNDCETVESVLCGHSERLAIVFNLLQRPIPTRIQIVQNLRICGDCRKWKNYLI
ncbi:unnamed protein product [Rotaria socialis]|uniref:DYW domain-containing protein n=1 Tax=Rotaria socialis TaxID=392032 RepID=A0A817UBX9_9BILA|nr:unnamed protein product [Rotaria socialis]